MARTVAGRRAGLYGVKPPLTFVPRKVMPPAQQVAAAPRSGKSMISMAQHAAPVKRIAGVKRMPLKKHQASKDEVAYNRVQDLVTHGAVRPAGAPRTSDFVNSIKPRVNKALKRTTKLAKSFAKYHNTSRHHKPGILLGKRNTQAMFPCKTVVHEDGTRSVVCLAKTAWPYLDVAKPVKITKHGQQAWARHKHRKNVEKGAAKRQRAIRKSRK